MYKQFYLINGRVIPFISGAKGGKGCFAMGTLIDTNKGKKPIESILPGDLVKSFSHDGEISFQKVTDTFYHKKQSVAKVTLWNEETLVVTDNHWFLTELNTFKEIKHFNRDETLVSFDKQKLIIKSIELDYALVDTYNLTIDNNNTYIANDVFVHNKGGGKGGGATGSASEADDTLFSTDLLFVLAALGEGPIYRVNSNGPQDIEVNEGSIDDLLNINGDGLINPNLFYYSYTTGTLNQAPLKIFGDSTISPQSMSNPVTLRYGNRPGVPTAAVRYVSTSTGTAWNQLTFKFNLQSLARMDSQGNIYGSGIDLAIYVYDSTGGTLIGSFPAAIYGKTTSSFKFDVDFIIPEQFVSSLGYKFSIFKTSADPVDSKIQDTVIFYGWDETQYGERAYPRTALVGYVVAATSQYQGNIPTVTSMVKGLLCRVPSNYNQPVLENGEVDWRQVEVSDANRTTYGYFQQKTGSTRLTAQNPTIYDGLWDGTFVYNWTQNPVWIVFEMLTNKTWGLGVPVEHIDKYNFYKVAQYADGIDQKTCKFVGVDATADGTWRYKPSTLYTAVREILIGVPNGTLVKERRFIFDALISSKKQIMDTINQMTASFRGMLFYSAGKLTLNVDMPDELPMAIFNETNIVEGSLRLSGMKESDIITGVDVSFVDPLNHYKRETIRISDDNILREVNHIENVKAVDLSGCTRRSIATRFAQYLLASGKYLRRKAEFKSSVEAIHLTVGDIISVSTKVSGTSWGHAGRVFTDAAISNSNVYLEHFTQPGLSTSLFTSNVNPLALRVLKQNSDRVDYYLLSNTNYELLNTGNVISGYDVARVQVDKRFNPTTKTFGSSGFTFAANTVPAKHDLWTLGEVDPNNIFTSQSDKLFKITQVDRLEDHDIQINAVEYISNVYVDSESLIAYTPVVYRDLSSILVAPPTPSLSLTPRTTRNSDGSITYAVDINSSTDTTGYPIQIQTNFDIAYPDTLSEITGIY
jgi:hypothetical protein